MNALAFALVLVAGCGGREPVGPAPVGPFPAGFHFGSAVAPYQVEGGLHATDWYQWETRCPRCTEDRADDGPQSWIHWEQDLAAARQELHHNAIRLGIEWARIFPTEASFPDHPDEAAVARYQQILHAARAQGLTVNVTIFHFSLPTWIQDLDDLPRRAGWEDPATVDKFAAWARFCGARFGADVDWWITINEPIPFLYGGWVGGVFPPGKQFEVAGMKRALDNLIAGHARAYDALHAADTLDADGDGKPAMVSIAHHHRIFRALDDTPRSVAAARLTEYLWGRYFLDAVTRGDVDRNFDEDADDPGDSKTDPTLAHRLDWIGLNYYGVSIVLPLGDANFPVTGGPSMNDIDRWRVLTDLPVTDYGWAIYPEGLHPILDELATYKLPILITENGLADGSDAQRPRFIALHLAEVARAIERGVDVRGYYHWSLVDNFEWASGFCPQFGLLHVDRTRPDRPRTAGAGAAAYRAIIDANTVPPSLLLQYPDYGAPGYCPRVGI